MFGKNNIFYILLLTFFIGCAGKEKTILKNVVEEKTVKKTIYHKKDVLIRPGEIRRVLFLFDDSLKQDFVSCKNKKIPTYKNDQNQMSFILSETYFSNEKSYHCYFLKKDNNERLDLFQIIIEKKKFPSERLRVARKRVSLSKKSLGRVGKEQKHLNMVYSSSPNKPLFRKPFVLPIKSKVTSIFGTMRVFNNVRKGQHLGTDYRAAVGTSISAANSGKVSIARSLFFTGGTVTIDHGLGIFTIYGHLSKILVKEGDLVSRFDIIGLAGKSGRVTGPHLHWGVKVNGDFIEGDSLIREIK